MSSSFRSGLDGFSKRLNDLAETKRLGLLEAFTPEFMAAHTKGKDLPTFIEAGHFDPGNNDAERFKAMTESPEFNSYVKANSTFDTWSEMLSAATTAWMKRKLEG